MSAHPQSNRARRVFRLTPAGVCSCYRLRCGRIGVRAAHLVISCAECGHHDYMQSRPRAPTAWRRGQDRPAALTLTLALALALAGGCSNSPSAKQDLDLPAGIFGGAPAVEQPILAGMSALLGNAGTAVLPDPCASVAPGRLALIDDFEDGDTAGIEEEGRQIFWFTFHDETPGKLLPDELFLPSPGGTRDSHLAAHVNAFGFSQWGAGFGAAVTNVTGSVRCPFNASGFSGIRFSARGSGRVRVSLSVPEVVEEQFGGTCRPSAKEICNDLHGAWFTLTPTYSAYSFKWSDFVQRQFGKRALFQPARIVAMQFTFEKDQLPIDAWFDDVSWDDGSPLPDPQSSGGTGGGGSSGVQGGGSSVAGVSEGGAAGSSGSSAGETAAL